MFSALINLLPKGIGLRFSLWFTLLFTACSLVFLILTYLFAAQTLRQRDQRLIIEKHRELAAFNKGPDLGSFIGEIQSKTSVDELEFFIRVTDEEGRQIYVDSNFDDLEEFGEIPRPGTAGVPLAGGLWNEILSGEGDEYLELYSSQLPFGGWLEVGQSSEDREDILASFRDQMPWIGISLLISGLCCGIFFSNRALGPIRELIHTVSNIKSGNFSARVKNGTTDDELGTLSHLFNEMLDQIQALINGLNQTTDGLAHDIKTPITRLRADAELALAHGASEERMREALITTIENSDQIISMIDSLMDMSEAEAGSMQLSFKEVDLEDVILNVLDLYEFAAEEKSIVLLYKERPPSAVNRPSRPRENASGRGKLLVRGDIVQLRRALANLIDNAIKYGRPGDRVTISTSLTPQTIIVKVQDTGRGIPEHDLPHIWSRFFRGEQGRSEKGLGLGLSLVKAIVGVHGGKVSVQSTFGKGAEFSLEFARITESRIPYLTKL